MVPCYGACAAPDLALSRICKVSTALQKTFASRCMDFLQEPVWGIIDGTGAGQVTFQMSCDDEPGLVWPPRWQCAFYTYPCTLLYDYGQFMPTSSCS